MLYLYTKNNNNMQKLSQPLYTVFILECVFERCLSSMSFKVISYNLWKIYFFVIIKFTIIVIIGNDNVTAMSKVFGLYT